MRWWKLQETLICVFRKNGYIQSTWSILWILESLKVCKNFLLLVDNWSNDCSLKGVKFLQSLQSGPACSLQVRILFHIARKKKDGKTLMEYHEKLGESIEDQLSLASFHYLQARYQDAIEIYKTLLLEHRWNDFRIANSV